MKKIVALMSSVIKTLGWRTLLANSVVRRLRIPTTFSPYENIFVGTFFSYHTQYLSVPLSHSAFLDMFIVL